eukprot:gene17560-23124_t
MKVLLDAIRELVIALRFGNEIYSRGDPMKARDIFTDALNLFVLNHNTKGIGACHNNLGAVEMTVKNYNQSEVNYNESIKIGESLLNDYIKKSKNESTIHPMDSTNLNVVYSEAFNILENLLLEDKKHFYIKGCVIKQGTLGHYYLRQNEFKQAWNMFDSIIKYVYKQEDDDAYNTGRDSNQSQLLWNYQEAEVAKQIAPNIDFPLGAKHGRETIIEQSILKLNSPSGSTAMRDAINLAIDSLQINRTSNDWIITLTDGDDNSSHMKESNLTNKITNLNVNVIIIGVGSDVNHDQLQKIVKASKKGMYIASSSDNKGITEAFGKAIEIIQGQVILEDL